MDVSDSYDSGRFISLWAAAALRRDQAYVDAQLDHILELEKNKEYLELPSELATLGSRASQSKRARLRTKLISELHTAEGQFRIWTLVQLIALVTAADDATSRLEVAKAVLSQTRDELFVSSHERGAWQSLVADLPEKDARDLADSVLAKAVDSDVAVDSLQLLSPVAGKLSESQTARVTDRLYSLLVDDSSARAERLSAFEDRQEVARARSCGGLLQHRRVKLWTKLF